MATDKPYFRRVNEVIDEELTNAGLVRCELPEHVQFALGIIASRLADDLESTRIIASEGSSNREVSEHERMGLSGNIMITDRSRRLQSKELCGND